MTVQPLREYDDQVVVRVVRDARRALEELVQVPVESIGADGLIDLVSELAVLESQAAAAKLRALAEADQRRLARELGATGTDAWAASLTGTTRGVMAGGIWLANRLRDTYHLTRRAFADGGINEAQARVIVKSAEKIPSGVTDEQRRAAEEGLVVKAVNGMNARGLRQAGRRMLDVVSKELADRHEATQLVDEERRAEIKTYLEMHDNFDGTYSGRFTVPELQGQMLRAALERLSSPRHLSVNRAGGPVQDASVPGMNIYESLGLAFCELVEHLPTTGFGPNAVCTIVHLPLEHLLDGLGSARLDTGTRISPGEARRLCCSSGLVPAVLGTASEPLDLGRMARLHTGAQRRAYSVLHETCATEGCERPFAWCEIHHPTWWSRGGRTDLDNGVPLCGFHHRRAHDERFDLRRLASGEVRFTRRT